MLKISQIEGKIFRIEAQIKEAKKQGNMELLESLRLENTQLRQQLEDRRKLQNVVEVMVNECRRVYASKDDNKINKWLNNNYKPFRLYWINRVGEDVFCEIWNKVNEATK